MAVEFTSLKALPAADAFIGEEYKFGLAADGFWIVTPPALKRTPFEEHRCTDSRPIVNCEFLDVEDPSCRRFHVRCLPNFQELAS